MEMLNVLSLYTAGTLQNLFKVTKDYKIDLLAVQEVRGLGWSVIENDCRICYCCDEEENSFGAGFIVRKRIRSRVINSKPTEMRMWVLRIRGEFKNYSPICVRVLM